MKLSLLIKKLQAIKKKEGDLNVCVSDSAEYWGHVHRYVREDDVKVSEHVQPDGPKSGKSERAILFEY